MKLLTSGVIRDCFVYEKTRAVYLMHLIVDNIIVEKFFFSSNSINKFHSRCSFHCKFRVVQVCCKFPVLESKMRDLLAFEVEFPEFLGCSPQFCRTRGRASENGMRWNMHWDAFLISNFPFSLLRVKKCKRDAQTSGKITLFHITMA